MTLLEQVWEKLDADMLELKQPGTGTDFVSLKARLRAFAEVLAIFMAPHFTTADEIAREAVRRYDHRLDSEYCTPGLKQRRLDPPPGEMRLHEMPLAPKSRKSTPRVSPTEKALSLLTDEKKESIRLFAKNNFPHDVLARTHGVSVAVIEAVVKG